MTHTTPTNSFASIDINKRTYYDENETTSINLVFGLGCKKLLTILSMDLITVNLK